VNVFNYLKRPEYIFRPRQVLNRFRRMGKEIPPTASVRLPWGFTVKVQTNEHVGCDIFHYGIFDRIVPEAIYRLADESEVGVEAGANIGQNCSLLAFKTGPGGHVIVFEPHPEIFQELKFNANLWPEKTKREVQLENCALSDTPGEAWFVDGAEFFHNRGSASLCKGEPETIQGRKYKVAVRRLDDFLPAPMTVGVCKIDVEGHELEVLKGAQQTLERRAIRDIIFEDFNPKPSPVTKLLAQYGFTIFELHETWLRPILAPISSGNVPRAGKFSSNYLATMDPGRAVKRFRSPGWRCLLNI
jgi:FkbM family methyltransferase